jgi:hypothetical protein
MIILSYDQCWWWDYYDWVFRINKLAMMTIILTYVCDWFNQRWVNLCTFHLRFIWNYVLNGKLSCRGRKFPLWEIILQSKKGPWWEIILQGKKGSLIRNYRAEQEKYKFHYLKSNPLMWNYLAEQEKNIIHTIDHW